MSAVPQAPLRVALRVDASATIGTGHLRRCLSLGEALAEQGAAVILIVRRLDAVAPHVLKDCTFQVCWLPAPGHDDAPDADDPPHVMWAGVAWRRDADETFAALLDVSPQWLVVDHYAIDARWHDVLRDALGCRLLIVDDIADRLLSADILLDQNWAEDHRAKYHGRLTREPKWLTGPRYALLSAAYRNAPRYRFHTEVRSIGIFMGGTDPCCASASALRCLREEVGFTGQVEVVSTSANPHLSALRKACMASPRTMLTLDLPDLAAFFARHDLQIGAGGGSIWERCCIGPPTVSMIVAANQATSLPLLSRLGVLRTAVLGDLPTSLLVGHAEPLGAVVIRHIVNPEERRVQAQAASYLVDGRGAQRAALALTAPTLSVCRGSLEHLEQLHKWRNEPEIRRVSFPQVPPDSDLHLGWLKSVTESSNSALFIGKVGGTSVGFAHFDELESSAAIVSIAIDPVFHKLGLGRYLLLTAEEALCGWMKFPLHLVADIKPENVSAISVFLKSGYSTENGVYKKTLLPSALAIRRMERKANVLK